MLTFLVLVFFGLAGCVKSTEEDLQEISLEETEEEEPGENGKDTEEDSEQEEPAPVFVYVCGAVNAPGVYSMDSTSRVCDAVEMAGGMTADASAESVNQARLVVDGEQIYIPTEEEAAAGGGHPAVSQGAAEKKVNINTAGEEELMTLTGIGEAKASAIISYREKNGGFRSTEELMQIEGIKEGVFNKIKDDITV